MREYVCIDAREDRYLTTRQNVEASNDNFVTGSIFTDAELKTWLTRANAPSKNQQQGKLLGSIRLLVCNRKQYAPLDFALSRQSFELMEKTFELSPLTLASLESEPGTYSRFLVHSDTDRSKLRRIRKCMMTFHR